MVGPCKVLGRRGDTGRYTIELATGEVDLHMERLKPYLSNLEGKALPFWYYRAATKVPEEDGYVVEKFIEHRIQNGRHEWRVRWKGYGPVSDTWEPMESFVGTIHKEWLKWNKENKVVLQLGSLK